MAVVHTTAGGVHRTLGGGALPIPKQPLFRALARRCLTTPQKGVVTFTHAAGAANVTTSSPHNLSRPSGDLREPNNLGRPQESPLRRQTSENRAVLGRVWGPQGRGAQVFAGAPGAQSAAVLPPTAAAAAAGRPHGPSAQSSWRNARRSSPGNPRRPPAARMACRFWRSSTSAPAIPAPGGETSRAEFTANRWPPAAAQGLRAPRSCWEIRTVFQRFPGIPGFPEISEDFRKFPEIPGNFREFRKTPGKWGPGPTPHASETDPTCPYTSFWGPTVPNITLFRPAAEFSYTFGIYAVGPGGVVASWRPCGGR